MRYGHVYERGPAFGFGGAVPPGVRLLLVANAAAYFFFNILLQVNWGADSLGRWLPLSTLGVLHGRLWQYATYLFLHGSTWHLLFNMLYLYMFGSIVERRLGTRPFLRYFFVTGIGAGVVWTLAHLGHSAGVPTIGASGAIYAVLLAYALLYPNNVVLLFFILPVRAKYLVAVLIGLEVLYLGSSNMDGVAHLIHLAGAGIGYLYMKRGFGFSLSPFRLYDRYRRWRIRRRLSVIDYRELMKFDDEKEDFPGGKGRRG